MNSFPRCWGSSLSAEGSARDRFVMRHNLFCSAQTAPGLRLGGNLPAPRVYLHGSEPLAPRSHPPAPAGRKWLLPQ